MRESSDLYLIINFKIPIFNENEYDEDEIFIETWHENSNGFVNPFMECTHTTKVYHGKDDGKRYIIEQCGLFKYLFVVKEYQKYHKK